MKNKNINKKDFIKILQNKLNFSTKQTEEGIDAILYFLEVAFAQEKEVEIRGFGKFYTKNGKVKFKSFIAFKFE